jgi:hypothetical protein
MIYLNITQANFSPAIGQYHDLDIQVMWRQQVGYFLGPLNKTVLARVKILFVTHIQGLALVFQPVKIKVVYFTFRDEVLIHDRERGAAHIFIRTQGRAYRFDERGFTRTHLAMKKEDLLMACRFNNLPGGGINGAYSGSNGWAMHHRFEKTWVNMGIFYFLFSKS